MGLQVLALACLVGAIILGFVRKMNVGIVCFGLALILGTIGGMASGKIYGGFPYKLFSTLLGKMCIRDRLIAVHTVVNHICRGEIVKQLSGTVDFRFFNRLQI